MGNQGILLILSSEYGNTGIMIMEKNMETTTL